jgi:hypothetical protein
MGQKFDNEFEDEFAVKCEEVAMYQPEERVTLDGIWKYGELRDDVFDECYKMSEDIQKDHLHRAVRDRNLLKPDILAERIIANNDLIDRYNEAVANNDAKVFGIVKFDGWLWREIDRVLKENTVK